VSAGRRPWRSDPAGLELARQALESGQVIGFPTDTVYGLAASARLPDALFLISRIKGRDPHQPLILMGADRADLDEFVVWNDVARQMAERFWPGPLTLILRSQPRAEPLGGPGTVGVRIPNHHLALRLLRAAGPLGTTSANLHGQPPLPDASSALAQLPQLAGALSSRRRASAGAEPSSILDLSQEVPALVRAGRLGAAELGLPVSAARATGRRK
jgi:tRNA threonylcarbamoyl adenosine modification protein (Sua5/YciO/YrdC/YwlC family)